MSYTSPDPDDPERGFLAAEAVEFLIPYIRNFVMDNKDVMIPPPFPIDVPPLQTFTRIAVAGRVVARTMLHHQTTSKKEEKKQDPAKEEKTQGGPGSPSGTTPPPKPQISGKIVVKVTGKKRVRSRRKTQRRVGMKTQRMMARMNTRRRRKTSRRSRSWRRHHYP
jgi:hypothetical protein